MNRYVQAQIGIGSRVWRRRHVALAASFVAAVAFATAASASEEGHFDVLLYDDNGNVAAGAVDVDDSTPFLDTVVVEGELFGDSTAVTPTWNGDDPGFFSFSDANAGALAPFDNLPGNAAVTLDFLVEPTLGRSLSYWDDGLGMFTDVPAGESLNLSKDATDFGDLSGTNEVLGVAIGSTSGTGFLDDHPDYDLGAGTAGAYLIYGEASVAGLAGPSNPFWIVLGTLDECELDDSCDPYDPLAEPPIGIGGTGEFNFLIEEQIEAAIDYTNANLVPEPGSFALTAAGLIGLGAAGRRRRR